LCGQLLGVLNLNQWILFSDETGIHYAQPDAYLIVPERILLMEIKLTQTDTAKLQLLRLYLPLLQKIYDMPVVCLQICKRLRYEPKKLVENPLELLASPGPGVYTWHYRGV